MSRERTKSKFIKKSLFTHDSAIEKAVIGVKDNPKSKYMLRL